MYVAVELRCGDYGTRINHRSGRDCRASTEPLGRGRELCAATRTQLKAMHRRVSSGFAAEWVSRTQYRASERVVVRCARLFNQFGKVSLMLTRVKIDPKVCSGRPTIRGMRYTVDFVLKLLGDGYTADDIVRLYPELEKEDVYEAAKYGAWLASERTSVLA